MADRRPVHELSLHELETLVEQRRRIERARRLADGSSGRFRPVTVQKAAYDEEPQPFLESIGTRLLGHWRDKILLVVELAAAIALLIVVVGSLVSLQKLNDEVAQARSAAPARVTDQELPGSSYPPPDGASELPGSSSPPVAAPAALGISLQAVAAVPVPTPGARSPTRILIPALNVDWPVVEGDGWEELKQGIGHRVATANPGERGNLILSGHNDVYGEPFRDLEKLENGKEVIVYAGANAFRYIIRARRVVEPNDLSVLASSRSPILTLITCTPYRVDTQRLVLIGELVP